MEQATISIWTLVLMGASIAVPTLGAVIGAWIALVIRIGKVETGSEIRLQAFQIEAMDKFVRSEHLDKMEQKILQSEDRLLKVIKELSERIEHQTDRMDELLTLIGKRQNIRESPD